jgi:murein tripeptide amidase MpaA
MNKLRLRAAPRFAALLLCGLLAMEENRAQTDATRPPAEWLTHAEKTNYRETPTYADTIAYARRLAAASPLVEYREFGVSGEGRALPLLVAAKNGATTPEAARRAGRPVVLIQACIHAGEPDGKDAGLALLRDIAVTREREALLDGAVLLFVPIYNVDGHEQRSPYNRINQNGPAEMGWRGNAANLNLNRDYLKADAPETRAWLKLWNEWRPDLFVDCHVTDGADFRYTVTYQFERHENVHPAVAAWSAEAFAGRVIPSAEVGGQLFSPYMVFRDNRDPRRGIDAFVSTPRFATGYVPLVRNRPALLIETHMLKDFRTRVLGTYHVLRAALEEVNRRPAELLAAVRRADEETAAAGRAYDPERRVALKVELTDRPAEMVLKGWQYRTSLSEVSGDLQVVWDTTKPLDLTVPHYDEADPTVSVSQPLAYLVPPQWRAAIDVLAAHGLSLWRLAEPTSVDVESYRFREVRLAAAPFEGRVPVNFKVEALRERRLYPAGTVVVMMNQRDARAALHLLEPAAPDSLALWGFFNPIFEQKEYAEAYVLEKLAREMMRQDEALRAEFERRIAQDPKFAASAADRLNFFYQRSPYWDRRLNIYPVGRVLTPLQARLADY